MMDPEILESYLRQGLSLEAIGRLTGRHPTTVGYWVKQHGLAAVHRDRHAPRGGIDLETLTALVNEGLSTREIAQRLSLSQSTVRHWLRRHQLRTYRARRRESGGTRGVDPDRRVQECARHGVTEFWLEGPRHLPMLTLPLRGSSRRRRRMKEMLVAEAGGRCSICGYDRYLGALQFHHRDDASKEFGLGNRGLTRSLDTVRAEAQKCVLLCANCHSEVEAGIVKAA